MVKKLFILCLGFGLAMGLVACNDKDKKNENANQPAAESVTIETMSVTPNTGATPTTATPADNNAMTTSPVTTTTTPQGPEGGQTTTTTTTTPDANSTNP